MSHYSIEEFSNLHGTYLQYPSYQAQYTAADDGTIEQGQYLYQNFPPAPIDWNETSNTTVVPSGSQVSVNLPITLLQNGLSGMSPHSYLNIVTNNSRTLPVAAPVPVPHATRMKATLRTVISFSDKDDEHMYDDSTAGGELRKITGARTRMDPDNHVLHPEIQAEIDYNTLANVDNSKQVFTGRSKLVIRPISPSTLMALTEPCLMAWCTAFDGSLAEPGSSAYIPLRTSNYNNYGDTKSNVVCNAWGY